MTHEEPRGTMAMIPARAITPTDTTTGERKDPATDLEIGDATDAQNPLMIRVDVDRVREAVAT